MTGLAAATLEIDLGGIVANWRALCAAHPSGKVAAVVKADAYGLGALAVVPALHAAGCRHFFTALPAEALAISDHAPGALIGVLNGLLPGAAADYAAGGLVPALGSLAEIDAWAAEARRLGRKLPALLHIDTGMSRLGLSPAEVDALAADHGRLAGVDLLYVMTHFVAAEEPHNPLNDAQKARFDAARARLPAAPTSLANSSGIFLGAAFASDLARPGAALYGVNPTPGRPNPMRVPLRLTATVLAVREIGLGAGVGYNATWTARRPSRIATVAVGYADGFLRSQSNRGAAVFQDRVLPLVGRVSMDLTTFDATEMPELCAGDAVELIGPGRPPDAVAEAAGTNGYEILTSLGGRFRRVYLPAS
ncbi:MAG TPA: alanine racemase [Acetobacteraceae bacterium]|nr:alanine racemase [Acetobacteraceae bacterium]